MIGFLKQYALLAALVVALAGLSTALYQTTRALSRTTAQVDALSARVEALAARTARIQTQVTQSNKDAQEATHALDQAIAQDVADAAVRTPPAVVARLCKHLRCAP